jgi:hypothetical protein
MWKSSRNMSWPWSRPSMPIALQRSAGPCVRPSTFFTGSNARSSTAEASPSAWVTTFMHQCMP